MQIAVAYHGKEVAIHRDGKPYARYDMPPSPPTFTSGASCSWACATWKSSAAPTFRGEIEDARIYPEALDAQTPVDAQARPAVGKPPLALVDVRGDTASTA